MCILPLQTSEKLAAALDQQAELEAQLREYRQRFEGAGASADTLRLQLAAANKEVEAERWHTWMCPACVACQVGCLAGCAWCTSPGPGCPP